IKARLPPPLVAQPRWRSQTPPRVASGAPRYQQDGATPHTGKDNPEILNSAGMGRGWLVELKTQPLQSPDLNVNDLGI
ncbi:unnamed protein product, partial [Laminaria digitata]